MVTVYEIHLIKATKILQKKYARNIANWIILAKLRKRFTNACLVCCNIFKM